MATSIFISSAGTGVMVQAGGILVDSSEPVGITLPTPTYTPTDPSFTPGTPGQTLVTFSAKPSGATRSLSPNDGRIALSGDGSLVLEGGSAATPGSNFNVTVTDSDPAAINSPQSVTFSINVNSGAVGSAFSAPVRLTGRNAGANSIIRMGMPFQRGHLAPGGALSYRRANGTLLPTQYDNMSKLWPDGTIRYAVIHVRDPGLINGQLEAGSLVPEAGPSAGPNISLATALAGQAVRVEIKNGGSVFTLDVAANLPTARWWQGPLASSARVEADVPRSAVGGTSDTRLIVDVTYTADGVIECDASLWNRNCYEPNQGTCNFDMRIIGNSDTSGSVNKAQKSGVTVRLYCHYTMAARWKTVDGSAAATPAFPWQSTNYMMRTGWVAHYDQGLQYNASIITGYQNQMSSIEWNDPLSTRGIKTNMGGTGGSNIVGETIQGCATWLCTGNPVAAQYAMDQSDATGTIPWHCWGRAYGRWVNPIDLPWRRTWYPNDSEFVRSQAENNPWQIDTGHWPDASFVPYLLTGRRVCLDRVMAQAFYGISSRWPEGVRGIPSNTADTEAGRNARLESILSSAVGVRLHTWAQVRDSAWCLRQLIGASIAPASEQPFGDLVDRILLGNQNHLWSQIPSMQSAQGQIFGVPTIWIYGSDNGWGAPWQMEMLVSQHIRQARLGVPNALEYLVLTDNYHSGKFISNSQGFNPADGTAYNIKYSADNTLPPPWIQTWSALKPDYSPGPNYNKITTSVGTDYVQRALAVNSQLCDLFADLGVDSTKALGARQFLLNVPKAITFTNTDSFRNDVQLSITRRGETRGP